MNSPKFATKSKKHVALYCVGLKIASYAEKSQELHLPRGIQRENSEPSCNRLRPDRLASSEHLPRGLDATVVVSVDHTIRFETLADIEDD